MPEEVTSTFPNIDGPQNPRVRAELAFFETPNGGGVFCTGSIAWAGSLWHRGYDNNVSRITGNVLRRFKDPKPLMSPNSLMALTDSPSRPPKGGEGWGEGSLHRASCRTSSFPRPPKGRGPG